MVEKKNNAEHMKWDYTPPPSAPVYDKRTSETTDEWLTPPEIVFALGPFDLDPCAPINRPWNTAKKHYDKNDDGLSKDWEGRVWLNPPYGKATKFWIERLSDHGNGIGLVSAGTERQWFHKFIWEMADAVLFFKGRLKFHRYDGVVPKSDSAASAHVLVAYGRYNAQRLTESGIEGKVIQLRNGPQSIQTEEDCSQ